MTGKGTSPSSSAPRQPRRRWTIAVTLSVALLVIVGTLALGYYWYYPSQIGPAQPVSFSHRVHVGDKKISCVFCHPGAIDGERAGVPPEQTCMLCHSRIIVTHPQIKLLHEYYDQRKPIEWVRVNDVPEFVYFVHDMHTRGGFDCSRCHGNVAGMDRIHMASMEEVGANPMGSYQFKMGFCIQCHRDNKAPGDCMTCHR